MNLVLLRLDHVAGSKLRGNSEHTSLSSGLEEENVPVTGLETDEATFSAGRMYEKTKGKLNINGTTPPDALRKPRKARLFISLGNSNQVRSGATAECVRRPLVLPIVAAR